MAASSAAEGDGRPALSVFHTRRLLQVIELPLDNSDETNVILSFASRCAEKKQFQAFYCADKTLLLRSLEEDLHPRFWRVPWNLALDRIAQASPFFSTAAPTLQGPPSSSSSFGISLPVLNPLSFGDEMPFASSSSLPPLSASSTQSAASYATNGQQVVALEFSPEGDWLVVVVAWGHKMFLLLLPVAALVARERKLTLQMHLKDVAPGDLMSVAPSPMATQMMSYLRAHGHNGAKYKSTVAGDAEDLSTLEFSTGMTTPTCVVWWRSFNGHNYVLVGSSSDLISIVHVETNQETCRCELSGKILSMDLVHDDANATSLLVATRKHKVVHYYKVLLERRSSDGAVLTFPEHFLDDKAFRPQRIKQFPDASLHVVRDLFARSSGLVALDSKAQTITTFADLNWRLESSYLLPTLDVSDPQLVYCSSQLLLVQGSTHDAQALAVWISRPSRDDGSSNAQAARVVHTLKLRQDESVRRVVPGKSLGGDDLLFFVHTDHQVYECRPKWSRLSLFEALLERSIHVQDAVSIGYSIGIDMASLCEVVADTICAREPSKAISRNSCEWIMRLYAYSRVLPSKAVEKLVLHGGLVNAIEYTRDVLLRPGDATSHVERRVLSNVLVHSALRLLADQLPTSTSSVTWPWLLAFLGSNADFETDVALAACAAHDAVDAVLHVAIARHAILAGLLALQSAGLELSGDHVAMLLEKGHAAALVHCAVRGVFRRLPLQTQIHVMCQAPSSLVAQRDWLLRTLPSLDEASVVAMATVLDPRTVATKAAPTPPIDGTTYREWVSDVASRDDRALLTVLLRLNADQLNDKSPRLPTDAFSQIELERLLRAWAPQYRPPYLVLRCVDYANWAAAAVLYEAHGEWVDAIECKLQQHDLQQKTTLSASSADELTHLLMTLVVPAPTPELPLHTKLSLLSRILVQWFASGHTTSELEAFLQHPDHDGHVGGLVARLLFSSDVASDFAERDVQWVTECQKLPFTGAYVFQLCAQQLPTYDVASLASTTDMLLANIERNSDEIPLLQLGRQANLGLDDPIETHAKVFTCGHAYPKRVYDDDVLLVFEKRMASLPALRHTTRVLLDEYRKPGMVEAPCPVCAFARMQALVAQQQTTAAITREPPRVRIATVDQWTWK
ncbi:hypothetical protein SPRG_04510 [Saprolegnia parasitica CBS 223.65]|uniref:Uncharacterized protein n=1 Tax=Saprolegnia parasitica (strain CBS 223.65) TaxID=695850 RepID=A0A067CN01_SAPPC|nr:hypothetical protein SPRG_04510 [Saprolegnia parasitica CBS 223.65]KDO30610.1 hypothetical protein SPRG_04510 [Saprolegnia parasitica CBS 223.65]|eukprot:XP_012198821.1 hypothetical protein SPRG_04510 [Saprolegnia parasitica CBS 223.65]